ncbi:Protein mak11 [Balamuthia mandrillaris]
MKSGGRGGRGGGRGGRGGRGGGRGGRGRGGGRGGKTHRGAAADDSAVRATAELFSVVAGTYEKLLYGLSLHRLRVEQEEEGPRRSRETPAKKNKEKEAEEEEEEGEKGEEEEEYGTSEEEEEEFDSEEEEEDSLDEDEKAEREAAKRRQGKYRLVPTFIYSSHLNSVRALASYKHLLASGSADESIKVYDLKKKVEEATLLEHSGPITSVALYEHHLLAGSQDGAITVFDGENDWDCAATLKAHKGGVLALSVHPTGRLALSVGKDKNLKMWNLITGRCAFTTKLDTEVELVKWCPSGNVFATSSGKQLTITEAESGKARHVIDAPNHILAVEFVTDQVVAIGGEDGFLQCWNITHRTLVLEIQAHSNRIKDLSAVTVQTVHLEEVKTKHYLVSASSDGYVKVWKLDLSKANLTGSKAEAVKTPVAIRNLDARLTCVTATVVNPPILPTDENEGRERERTGKRFNKGKKNNNNKQQKNPHQQQKAGGEEKDQKGGNRKRKWNNNDNNNNSQSNNNNNKFNKNSGGGGGGRGRGKGGRGGRGGGGRGGGKSPQPPKKKTRNH